MPPLSSFAPAKLNLFLAVTGRRPDGFHELVSVVAKVSLADHLRAELVPLSGDPRFALTCDDPSIPADESNLVLKAAKAFADSVPWVARVRFTLEKRIPAGAGLGGGSSDAVTALQLLNQMAGGIMPPHDLARVAAQVGSDCPLFVADGPVIMRGRGEVLASLPPSAASRIRGRRVLIFKPAFSIATAWAYGQLAKGAPDSYLPAAEAEQRLAAWLDDPAIPVESLLYNNMEGPAFAKFVALPVLLEELREDFGLAPRMSGSGSACYAVLREDYNANAAIAAIRQSWGDSAFVTEARLA